MTWIILVWVTYIFYSIQCSILGGEVNMTCYVVNITHHISMSLPMNHFQSAKFVHLWHIRHFHLMNLGFSEHHFIYGHRHSASYQRKKYGADIIIHQIGTHFRNELGTVLFILKNLQNSEKNICIRSIKDKSWGSLFMWVILATIVPHF